MVINRIRHMSLPTVYSPCALCPSVSFSYKDKFSPSYFLAFARSRKFFYIIKARPIVPFIFIFTLSLFFPYRTDIFGNLFHINLLISAPPNFPCLLLFFSPLFYYYGRSWASWIRWWTGQRWPCTIAPPNRCHRMIRLSIRLIECQRKITIRLTGPFLRCRNRRRRF